MAGTKKKQGPTKVEQTVLSNGKLIEEVFKTKGWRTLIEPILDEMIVSVLGKKSNGLWLKGHFIKSRKDEKKEFYIGYACALQELNNSIQNYLISAETIKRRISERNEEEKEPKVQIPLVNDAEEEDIEDF